MRRIQFPRSASFLAACLLLAFAPASAQALTSYSALGTITVADAGAPFSVGDTFTLTFDVDTSGSLEGTGTGSAAYDALRNFSLSFSNGLFFFVSSGSVFEARTPGSDVWNLFMDTGAPGTFSDIPAVLDPPVGGADHFFRSVALVLEDLDSDLYTGIPPELIAPDPTDAEVQLLSLVWTALNAPSVVVEGELDSIVRIVPEPSHLVLLSLAVLGARARRNRGQASA